MFFRWMAVVFLGLALTAPAARADLTDQQPSFTRIAAKCGQGVSGPSFSKADYAAAYKDAAKATKEAKKQGNKARERAIDQQVKDMKDCEKKEIPTYPMPKIRNCVDFVREFNAFAAWASDKSSANLISDSQLDEMTQKFAQPANTCMRLIMTKCVKSTDTKTVLFVVDAIEAAQLAGGVSSYAKQTGVERRLTETNPAFLRPSFCEDTDYACKGDPERCADRVSRIKTAMQTYINR